MAIFWMLRRVRIGYKIERAILLVTNIIVNKSAEMMRVPRYFNLDMSANKRPCYIECLRPPYASFGLYSVQLKFFC